MVKAMQGKERNDESKEKDKKKLMFPKTAKVLKDTAKGTAAMTKAMGKAEKYNADRVFQKEKSRKVERVKAKKMGKFGNRS